MGHQMQKKRHKESKNEASEALTYPPSQAIEFCFIMIVLFCLLKIVAIGVAVSAVVVLQRRRQTFNDPNMESAITKY
mgnify:CR=1 FL=1